jgi:CHASE2 domain-containing sensor protein
VRLQTRDWEIGNTLGKSGGKQGVIMIRQRKYVRVLSLVLAFSLVGGTVIALFIAWPPLLVILAAVGVAVYLIYRARRQPRGK